MEGIRIARYSDIHPPELGGLLDASLAERHGLVRRTLEDWTDGINQFDQPGEAFFLASLDMTTVGMCGLNVDPFIDDPKVGRVRHLYVLPEFRRQNIGRRLVEACLAEAEGVFERVRLRTFDPAAVHFYEAFGFTATNEDAATHTLNLATSPRT